jgi:protein gp37
MAENSAIEWTKHTWNPWQGCRKVSAGCENCYMYRDKKRYGQDPITVIRSSKGTFNLPLKWRDPANVFVCSWSDFFIEDADEWRPEAWEIIRNTPHLTYQLLTKRAQNIADRLPADWGGGYPNVWIGVTCENQEQADKRIPILLQIPAKVRFVSVEPMLGPVDLTRIIYDRQTVIDSLKGLHGWPLPHADGPKLDWVICGGETGPGARPMHPDWVRSLRDQCVAAGVPFFLKQMEVDGRLVKMPKLDGQRWAQWPEGTA